MGGSNSRSWPDALQTSTEGGQNDRIKYAVSSCQGWPRYMEDAHAVVPNLDDNTSFFGVYDGHGGAEVALLCARLFHTELRNHPDYQNNLMRAMKGIFFSMDEVLQSDEWKELVKPPGDWIQFLKTAVCANYWPNTQAQTTPYVVPQETGSTACIVVIRGNKIMIGNVGDSRCVLSSNGQAIQLTTDHKPNKVIEKQRIRRAGGQVTRDKTPIIVGGQRQGYRLGAYRINGALAVSRVIGDFAFKQNSNLPPEEQAATCNPDLFCMDIDNEMEFLVIASDGIWDCMTTGSVVNFVRKYLRAGMSDLRIICEMLVRRALPSEDNATVIVVQFKSSADRLPPLTESDGGVRQAGAATGGNRTGRTLTTLVEEGEEEADDDDPTPPAMVRKGKKQQDGEAGGSETHPLLGGNEATEE